MANRFFLAAICLLFLLPATGRAQRSIGVEWNVPADTETAQVQLRRFSELGIRYLLIGKRPSEEAWRLISRLDFKVYALLPVRFAIIQTFTDADSSFIADTEKYLRYYRGHSSVEAIGLFAFGQIDEQAFQDGLLDFIHRLENTAARPLFYKTARVARTPADSLFDFKLLQVSQGKVLQRASVQAYQYIPELVSKWDLAPVKAFLEHTPSNTSIPVFFDASWLLAVLDRQPGFDKILRSYTTTNRPVFPLPENDTQNSSGINILTLTLLLTWFLFAATSYHSPVFIKSLGRYFEGHAFYVKDVMRRHIRSMLPGSSILLQHILLGGIVAYCTGNSLFSVLGFKAMSSHYPVLAFFGGGPVAFFWWGISITLCIEVLSVLWLWATNSKLTHLSQVVNLYPWLLQVNLLIATIIATLYLSAGSKILIYILSAAFLVLFIAAFITCSVDGVAFLPKEKKGKILYLSAGLYGFILSGIIIWIFLSPRLLNVAELAASLP